MRCDWKPLAGDDSRVYICTRCGYRMGVPPGLNAKTLLDSLPDCGVLVGRFLELVKQQSSPPSLPAQLRSYTRAVARWVGEGSPVRSDEEVVQIYETLCKPCEFYNAERLACNVCGCRLRESGSAFTNKIKMATEHCPKGKW